MKNHSRLRRTAAVTFAMTVGAAAVPAASSAACPFPKLDLTWARGAGLTDMMIWNTTVAMNDWSARTKVNITEIGDQARADIVVSAADVQVWPIGQPANVNAVTAQKCQNGKSVGQKTIAFDNNRPEVFGFNDRARRTAAHEVGHALGLEDNNRTEGTCGPGIPRNVTIMTIPASYTPNGGVCGPTLAATDDINGVNAIYK